MMFDPRSFFLAELDKQIDDITLDLGPCCACGSTEASVVVMMPFKAPVQGTGWGCKLCKLGKNGALAVLCEKCDDREVFPTHVIYGLPAGKGRWPLDKLTRPFRHDPARHDNDPELMRH